MIPFLYFLKNKFILLAVEYVSKWVEAVALSSNNAHVVLNLSKKNIFTKFGTLIAIINDSGKHFCNRKFEALLSKYGVIHKVVNP